MRAKTSRNFRRRARRSTAEMRGFRWKIFFRSPVEKVYDALTSDEGRASFWAESTRESGGAIEFTFPNGEQSAPGVFSIRYFGARTTFSLSAESGGTILVLEVDDGTEDDWLESYAGWISVLMNMKSVVDFGADLRNHDPKKSWDQGFVDN